MRERRPWVGRRRRMQDSLATMRAPNQLSAGPLWPGLTRLPRLVARGYLTVVPGRSSGPYHLCTTKARDIQAPTCDQFVILIGGAVHIPLTVRSGAAGRDRNRASRTPDPSATAASRVSRTPREIFGCGKLSAETSVQNRAIYVVIPLRVDRSICGMPAALRISFTVERNRPTPPGPDRLVPLALPPGEGDPKLPVGLLLAAFPSPCALWGDGSHTARLRPSAAKVVTCRGSNSQTPVRLRRAGIEGSRLLAVDLPASRPGLRLRRD
jgi:hypothetical protein